MRGVVLIIPFLFLVTTAEAAYLDLAWSPNEEADLAGYRVYYGTTSGEYINFVDVGNVTTYRLGGLLDSVTYFIALTAYDTTNNESEFSGEVSGIGSPDGDGNGLTGSDGGGGCFVSALLMGS